MRRDVGDGDAAVLVPLVGNEANVPVAHGRLSEEINAVLIVEAVHLVIMLAQVRKVVVRVHELLDTLEAMDLVVDVERAEVAVAIRGRNVDILPAQVPHVLGHNDDVLGYNFGLERTM